MTLEIGEQVGPYEVKARLEENGITVTFLAIDKKLEREVWLKVLQHPDAPTNEARTLAKLQHKAIVKLLDVGTSERSIDYVVLEPMAISLYQVLREKSESPIERAVGVLAEIADALEHVHRRGILHRNVSPRSVVFDVDGRPHLQQFELALEREAWERPDSSGTLSCMAPEQLDPEGKLGPPTDVWGLGVVLYECLMGEWPFKGSDICRTEEAIRTAEPKPPEQVNASVPAELSKICRKCLTKNVHERYSTAALLAADLRGWLQRYTVSPGTRVFISHSSKDREFVEKEIVGALEAEGIRPWLESCEWFLLVVSANSLSSQWVTDEVWWAIDNRADRIIPVLLDESDPKKIHIRLARLQCVDFRTEREEGRRRLLGAFKGKPEAES